MVIESWVWICGFILFFYGEEISPKFLYHKKRSAMDAHSRDRNMLPSATALGASMLQATCFLVNDPLTPFSGAIIEEVL